MRSPLHLGAAALALASLSSLPARGYDHLDSPSVSSDPASDITDVYSWMDGSNVVLVMNVAPFATTASKFSDKVQYVFHTESTSALDKPGKKVDVICTFDAAQAIQCWVGSHEYLQGDASATAGLTSKSGKVKVFAGLRDDPAFFNLDGFNQFRSIVTAASGALTFDAAGCPQVDAATSAVLAKTLKSTPNSMDPAKDFFAGKNVLSLVVSIDKLLLTEGGARLSVWAATHKGN